MQGAKWRKSSQVGGIHKLGCDIGVDLILRKLFLAVRLVIHLEYFSDTYYIQTISLSVAYSCLIYVVFVFILLSRHLNFSSNMSTLLPGPYVVFWFVLLLFLIMVSAAFLLSFKRFYPLSSIFTLSSLLL